MRLVAIRTQRLAPWAVFTCVLSMDASFRIALGASRGLLRPSRRVALAVMLLTTGIVRAENAEQPRDALAKAVAYLWSQQAEDGGWHSPQYGVLKSGQAITPFVLHALLQAEDSMSGDEPGRFHRAAQFILRGRDFHGVLGRSDPELPEYPVYSTAYSALSFTRFQGFHEHLGPSGHAAIKQMRSYLALAQFDEAEGFSPADPCYGGWGFQEALRPGRSGHMDLSHTRCALQALRETHWEEPAPKAVSEKAAVFLRLVQKQPESAFRQPGADGGVTAVATLPFDGGFYFSPVVLDANKGRLEQTPTPHWRSYATATCDGILALLAASVPADDDRVTAAVAWLKRHTDVDYPQGVPSDYPEPWGEAIRFYHYSVRAEVYRQLDFPAADRAALAAAVVKQQREDGSFVNTASPLMKEDDPVLCTALAVVALTNCLP